MFRVRVVRAKLSTRSVPPCSESVSSSCCSCVLLPRSRFLHVSVFLVCSFFTCLISSKKHFFLHFSFLGQFLNVFHFSDAMRFRVAALALGVILPTSLSVIWLVFLVQRSKLFEQSSYTPRKPTSVRLVSRRSSFRTFHIPARRSGRSHTRVGHQSNVQMYII